MIGLLSPREEGDLRRAVAAGEGWARVILLRFTDGTHLRLGTDHALAEREIGEPRTTVERAMRWCAEHGLHLLAYEGEGPGGDTIGERHYFMAVG